MAVFTANLTGVTQLDDSLVLAFTKSFLIASQQGAVLEQFVAQQFQIDAKSIDFTKYNQLNLATTALTETDDLTSEAIADTRVTLTPAEYGNVVTRTSLASFQTGGKADIAAAQLVGLNMSRTQDKLCMLAGEASSNTATPTGSAEAALSATNDLMSAPFLNKMYNKLARQSVAPLADGMYVAVMHDDVIYDLRNATGAGSWTDVNKYAFPETVLKNEVGMMGGFRIVRDNHATVSTNVSGFVDSYRSLFLGANGLGKAVSKEPGIRLTGPFDKLGRFVNVGWYGCFQYKVVDIDAVWVGITASSIANNAS